MGRVRNSGGGSDQATHRAGPLKQANKKHKTGGHKSKRALDVETRGRVNSLGSIGKRKNKNHVLRSERKKQAAADRLKKMQMVMDEKRNQGGPRGAPICVTLIPLSTNTNVNFSLQYILANCKNFADVIGTVGNSTYVKLKNGKNITLVIPPASNDLWSVLDVLKQADVSLFLLPVLDPISPEGLTLLKAAKEQGLATPFLGVTSPFNKSEEKAFIKANTRYLPIDKVYEVSNPGQVSNLLRMISVTKITIPKQWSVRSSMLVESYTPITSISPTLFTPNAVEELSKEGCDKLVKISGVVKRKHLNPHRPVYITGIGSFKILRIDVTPMQLGRKNEMAVDQATPSVPPRFLYDPNAVPQEDIDKEVEDENMDSDSDIDEDDLSGDDDSASQMSVNSKTPKGKKKLPKGTSDYQKDWLVDSQENSEDEGGDSLIGSDDDMEDESAEKDDDDDEEPEDEDMDWEEEKKQMEMIKAARTEAEFPDWIDTPADQPASVRFQRYRGLQSFKKSPWDPNENLPKEYSKIFQFQNFRHVYKIVCGEKAETDGLGYIPVGQRVEMILKPIAPQSQSETAAAAVDIKIASCKPVSLVSLLRHETRMSVLNLQLNTGAEIMKNKEQLIFQLGHHRFQAKPILSEVSTGNKHRMLRFAQENQSCMATVLGPIVFPHASVLVFKCSKETLIPVASGSLFSIDPARIVVKRILLSGYPFKVLNRNAVVRFMFFNREDIEWFKPVELRTRYGRRGHIKEPLGTHGHMKCTFDGQMKSQDTVLMPLYKRVFPKWNFDEFVPPFDIFDQYVK